MASALRTPDHTARMLYDDFNELFWDHRCIDILNRHTVDNQIHENEMPTSAAAAHPSTDVESVPDAHSSHHPKSMFASSKRSLAGFSVSRENLNAVIVELSCSSKPGSGVKTFVEQRTYAQVSCTVDASTVISVWTKRITPTDSSSLINACPPGFCHL